MNIIGVLFPTVIWLLAIWIPENNILFKIIITAAATICTALTFFYTLPNHKGWLWVLGEKTSKNNSRCVVCSIITVVYLVAVIITVMLKSYIACIVPVCMFLMYAYELICEVKDNVN